MSIRNCRIRAGYTQDEVADKLFVTNAMISQWERGLHVPRKLTLLDLATLFHVQPDDLLRDEPPIRINGDLAVRLIKDHGIRRFAQECGIDADVLHHWLYRGVCPSLRNIRKIAKFFGLDITDFLMEDCA